jgi:hypothetical protein
MYEMDETAAFAACSLLHYKLADEKWLDFVFANRTGKYNGLPYEIIYGPVANDDIFQAFALYTSGIYTKAETIKALKVKKLFNQMVFTSEQALSYLKFVGIHDETEA